ncbi:MAG: SDR family NAD(P)-dependent oxidoreductase [Xanthomonadales bacterium]|jgi:NAD(P)-dependent dehydrogenase (short-subunit alcohol dehydrogenase family)|nr:SDR family NAD(P)-dependent oxidoreductase [Xanthomonadales bacterium]
MNMKLEGRVAIVTGAGRGLGRAHALALAQRGAKVLVNDLGGADGVSDNAEAVVEEIRTAGGEALANGASVSDWDQVEAMTRQALNEWGRVDILVNNAGILRDKSFLKMTMEEFRQVIDVHLMGTAYCSKAVWETMREQAYGRIVMTTSSTGLYGNFGQTNYGAAKMAMVGMMNTLHLEGAKYNIRVNCLAPAAGTAMTEGLIPEAAFKLLSPESVSPGVVFLVSDDAPSRTVLCAGGGSFAVYKGFETEGVNLAPDRVTAEGVAQSWAEITSMDGMRELQAGFEQTGKFAEQGAKALGIKLS